MNFDGGADEIYQARVAQSLGAVAMAFATSLPVAVLGAVLMGLSQSIGWSASNTFISALVRGPLRQRYFGVNFALLNLGIGVGGLIAGAFVDVARPVTFEAIFLLDAVLVLIPGIWLLGPLRHVHARAEHPGDGSSAAGHHFSASTAWLSGTGPWCGARSAPPMPRSRCRSRRRA